MDKPTLLISRCLLGEPVRYDCAGKALDAAALADLAARYRLVPVCPEQLGGLPTPHPPAELQDGDGQAARSGSARVVAVTGEDQTAAFIAGATQAVRIAQRQQARVALLKADSPSCGHRSVYDGRFRGIRIADQGVAAASLAEAGLIRTTNSSSLRY
ncbi:DUF523 domain-containing protein [Neisseriaceae bacterium JH1-16]|nr:DUF523 domain-containing protein [Neisseriaceae bacterium JH1-16]